MAVTEEPILSRLDRLDQLMRHLEEAKGSNRSTRSSSPSTPSSGTRTSDGNTFASSLDFSPRSHRDNKLHCRPIDDVIVEMEHKGTLLDRVAHMEDRLLKICIQLEQQREAEKRQRVDQGRSVQSQPQPHPEKKGLKQLVKSCVSVKGKSKKKSSQN